MAYFNHAFSKRFLGTGPTRNLASTGAPASVTNPYSDGGFIVTPGTSSTTLSDLPLGVSNLPKSGYFGFFDPNTYLAINPTLLTYNCCPLVLASASLLTNDKIGPFHGGYRETNKSKVINPKYVQKAYKVTTCVPQQAIVSVGTTPQTIVPALPAENFQGGTVQSNCCFQFLCGETYYLRVDIKGSPALRALNHNAYQTVDAYTGCCAGPTPTPVDPTTVYIQWATHITENNYLKPFVLPVVFDYTQVAWYAPGTTVDPVTGAAVTSAQWWTNYAASPQAAAWTSALPNTCEAGMRLFGAYVETKFGNCTFQVTDFFEKEPVKIYASMVDYTGDPCVFEGVCVYNDCLGMQGMGFGEQVARDLILSESYLQNFFASNDFRVREITQGYDILNSVNRNALYTRYFLLHSVPRFNNPTGVFDNDRYMLEIIVPEANPLVPVGNPTLDAFLTNWLNSCANCVPFETQGCTYCTPVNN
ncbi:MAG: hypothetical protein E6R13_09795 [Spirochaetes bacterium]|nr:MAG: hypothetical protein E6R13_09795 [Spirochaetota bacterium]